MIDIEREHHFLTDISASLSLLNLIAQLILMVLMLFGFRELREDVKSIPHQQACEEQCMNAQHSIPDGMSPQEETITQERYEALCD